ncbi:MAG: hypothetical protein AAGJ46_18345 [Planctomycetota bacterium]
MQTLLEDPAPILIAGALAVTVAAIVHSSVRSRASQAGVAAAVLLTLGAVITEWAWQTPAEQVHSAFEELLAAVEANDLPAVLAGLSPAATQVRADAQKLMPEFAIEKARVIGAVNVVPLSDATGYAVEARVFVQAGHRRTGMKGGKMADVVFTFDRQGERWLLTGYDASDDWRRGAAELRRGR